MALAERLILRTLRPMPVDGSRHRRAFARARASYLAATGSPLVPIALCAGLIGSGCGDRDRSPVMGDGGLDAGAVVQPDAALDAATTDATVPTDAGTLDGGSEPLPDAGPATCPVHEAPRSVGRLESAALDEASGLVASRSNTDVLWANNDSGDTPRLFALATTGRHLGTYSLATATARDWEDIAIARVDGRDMLYAADIGDNDRLHATVTVYRAPEPTVAADQTPVDLTLTEVESFELQYPDGPHNAETLIIDPISLDLYIVTKVASGAAQVFRGAAPLSTSVTTTLEQVATLPAPISVLITGGDVTVDGSAVYLRTYGAVRSWPRLPATPLWNAFLALPCEQPSPAETQGESLALAPDGTGFYTVSEGVQPPLNFVARR